VVDGKLVDLRVPYPLGFFTKNVDGRTTIPTAAGRDASVDDFWNAHRVPQRGRHAESPKVYKFQVRPSPLAN